MTQMSPEEYFANAELGDPRWLTTMANLPILLRSRGALPDDLSNLPGAVSGSTVLSFTSPASEQQIRDVLLGTLVASRMADSAHPDRFANTTTIQNWYRKYSEVLQMAGWSPGSSALVRQDISGASFRMDEEALTILRSVMSPGDSGLNPLMDTLAALESTANEDELRLFEFHSSLGTYGNFLLGTAEVTNEGLTMTIGYYYFKVIENRRRFLFFTWDSTRTEFWASVQRITLVESIFARVRPRIEQLVAQASINYFAPVSAN